MKPMAPAKNKHIATSGLNKPPVTRNQIQADINKLRPKEAEMENTWMTLSFAEEVDEATWAEVAWVAPNAKRRKKVVPTNSRRAAKRSFLKLVNKREGWRT